MSHPAAGRREWLETVPLAEREALVHELLATLPRCSLAETKGLIEDLMCVNIIELLPTELSLMIFQRLCYDDYRSLLTCALVSKRWRRLANHNTLWRDCCLRKGWDWHQPDRTNDLHTLISDPRSRDILQDDEGFEEEALISYPNMASTPLTPMVKSFSRHSAPVTLSAYRQLVPDYKLLHQTRTLLLNRIKHGNYRLTTLQTRNSPDAHTATIYCLQLYTYPGPAGQQVLFTGSRDTTIREWNLVSGEVERILRIHTRSVLSICAHGPYLASGGAGASVVVWDIHRDCLAKTISHHVGHVLCVRIDGKRLVSCAKDHTIRTYLLPSFKPHLVLREHRSAVNAIAVTPNEIISASGDRSVRIWNAETGEQMHVFEGHHARGLAAIAIDFNIYGSRRSAAILTGSSDSHVRLLDISTGTGWSTNKDTDGNISNHNSISLHESLRSAIPAHRNRWQRYASAHRFLVRSVCLSQNFAVTASYDQTIKVWDRTEGSLFADLTGGHVGRIFGVAQDATKIVSCGEDQRICIWDFAHGLDTSFI